MPHRTRVSLALKSLMRGSYCELTRARAAGLEASEPAAVPRVIKLTGLSAEEVRGLASEVSQEVTGTEERLALTRRERELV